MEAALFAAAAGLSVAALRRRKRNLGKGAAPRKRSARRDPYVVISDPAAFFEKRERFIEGGPARMVVITDFDFTCSKFWTPEGVRGASTHKVIEDCGLFSEEYHREAQALQRYYYPLEVSPSLSHADKYKYMVEWFTKAHDLLVKTGLRRADIREAVRGSSVRLRDGVTGFLDRLERENVPTLIFSAGLADVLEEILVQQARVPPNVHIAANRMEFDAGGTLVGFRDPCFHVFNKEASAVAGEPYFAGIRGRPNVLLLGDNLGDLKMSSGLDGANVLRVGFLNDRVHDRIDPYMRSFDLVVVYDGDFAAVNALVDDVVAGGRGAGAQDQSSAT